MSAVLTNNRFSEKCASISASKLLRHCVENTNESIFASHTVLHLVRYAAIRLTNTSKVCRASDNAAHLFDASKSDRLKSIT